MSRTPSQWSLRGRLVRGLRRLLRRRPADQPVVLLPYLGYVAQTADGPVARVRARAVREAITTTMGPVRGWRTLVETVAWFTTSEVPGLPVTAAGGRRTVQVRSDGDGYIEARVPVDPSTAPVVVLWMSAPHTPDTAVRAVALTDPHAPLVVSDIDDTILVTGVTEGLAMVRRTLLGDPTDRRAVDGMPALLRELAGTGPVFYVSTSPWNLYQRLTDILVHHNLPRGPLLLTDWGPARKQLLTRPALEYKVETISGLLAEFPGRSVVLVGDSGQHDIEVYTALVEQYPDRVRAVLIREVPGAPAPGRERAEDATRAAGVPFAFGAAGSLTAAARSAGLL